jgi:hypothetical protein
LAEVNRPPAMSWLPRTNAFVTYPLVRAPKVETRVPFEVSIVRLRWAAPLTVVNRPPTMIELPSGAAAIDSMNQELERVHAVHASHSMNPAFMQAFEATMAEMRSSASCPVDD